jgi:hypothetical protein
VDDGPRVTGTRAAPYPYAPRHGTFDRDTWFESGVSDARRLEGRSVDFQGFPASASHGEQCKDATHVEQACRGKTAIFLELPGIPFLRCIHPGVASRNQAGMMGDH